MNGSRTWYIVGLVAACALLVGTMAATFSHGHERNVRFSVGAGPGYGGMMGNGWGNGRGDGWGGGPGIGSGGMMRNGWGNDDDSPQAAAAAKSLAQAWVDENAAGATLSDALDMPMGFMFTVTRNNQTVAYLMVVNGSVRAHVLTSPTPAPSSSS